MVSNNGPMASENILELSDHDRELLEEIKSTIENDLDTELQGFKKVDRSVVREHVQNVNRVLGNIVTDNKTSTNNLVKACAILIGRKLGLKPSRKRRETIEPWWKRRINQSIKEIRGHINLFERKRRGDLKKTEKYKILEQKYKVKSKGLGIVLEESKQCLQAKSMKIERYDQRIEQYKVNRLFHQHQRESTNS